MRTDEACWIKSEISSRTPHASPVNFQFFGSTCVLCYQLKLDVPVDEQKPQKHSHLDYGPATL